MTLRPNESLQGRIRQKRPKKLSGITQGQLSQIWHFWIAVGLENLCLAFWHFLAFLAFFGDFGLEDFRLALMLFGNPGMMSLMLMVMPVRSAVTVSLPYCCFRTPFTTSQYRHTSTRSFLIPDRPISGAGAVFRDTSRRPHRTASNATNCR